MTFLQLVRFHLRVGVRVALRSLVPIASGVVAAAVLYGSPAVVTAPLGALMFPPEVSLGPALLAVALCAVVAKACAPPLVTGHSGWLRHLPASGVDRRRALTAGVVMAQAPVLVLIVLGGLPTVEERLATTVPRLMGLLPVAWGATLAVLRSSRPSARIAALCGAVAAWAGSWGGLVLALALLVLADARAGALLADTAPRLVRRRPAQPGSTLKIAPVAMGIWVVIAWRALRWRIVAGWLVVPSVLLPAWLFLRNNRLDSDQRLLAVRLGAVVAATVTMAVLADGLVRRRPPWPWIRSLPWSAGERVGYDALLLTAVGLPVVLGASALSPASLLPVLATVPALALRGSAAVRDGVGRSVGASGPLIVEGVLAAGVVALQPWCAAGLLGITPLLWRLAIESERRQPISRWHELHYLATGDPLSWSGT